MQRFQRFASGAGACFLIACFGIKNTTAMAEQAVRTQQRFTTGSLPPPQFADSDRARKLAGAFPELERLFAAWVQQRHMPGAVVGILIDGELAWVKTAGVRELDRDAVGKIQSRHLFANIGELLLR